MYILHFSELDFNLRLTPLCIPTTSENYKTLHTHTNEVRLRKASHNHLLHLLVMGPRHSCHQAPSLAQESVTQRSDSAWRKQRWCFPAPAQRCSSKGTKALNSWRCECNLNCIFPLSPESSAGYLHENNRVMCCVFGDVLHQRWVAGERDLGSNHCLHYGPLMT